MTEIERIIEKGIISEDFLKEELIDGCEVNTDLKKIWAVLLDLYMSLTKFARNMI